jgi:hypothetical protein
VSDDLSPPANSLALPSQVVAAVGLNASAKGFLIFLVFLFAGLNAAVNYWGYLGYPSASTFAYWSSAQSDCLTLARDHQSDLSPEGTPSIKVEGEWVRKGKLVVELAIRKNEADASFSSRLCIVGGGQTEIVPGLSQSAWQ